MFALLQECKLELERHDALIKSAVDSIADHHIGEREGAYLIPGGMVIARTRVNGTLYTAFVELLDSS
jgi:non-ribosomal peptide synthetase component E (peptide arylation enzyme)